AQGGAGGEGDEIHALGGSAAHRLREHGDAASVLLRLPSGELSQSFEVLARDLVVRADVHDGDRRFALRQRVDRAGGDDFGDEGLAQAYFVGDQEAVHRIVVGPQAPEGVVDRGALEGLESREQVLHVDQRCLGLVGFRGVHEFLPRSENSRTTSHIWRNSGGIRVSEFGSSRTSLTCSATVARRSMSVPTARTRGSNSTIGGVCWGCALPVPSTAISIDSSVKSCAAM